MQLPYFYFDQLDTSRKELLLDEDTSRHIVQVLRMKRGEMINLTDGKGNIVDATITGDHKKHCRVRIESIRYEEPPERQVTIAISLLKNSSRFEWFLEKATELGVRTIIPLICERTEKQKFRYDRMLGICTSALLQSRQCWLPVLHEPIAYELLFRQQEIASGGQKFIAHCMEGDKQAMKERAEFTDLSQVILIGPEGDFSARELELALENHFIPVSLGRTRLRTETAGVVAATLLTIG
jgi:16S rRNA (uracil1498-N3)-methyltransferase